MKSQRHLQGMRKVSRALSCLVLLASVGVLAASPHTNLDVVRPGREFKLRAGQQVTVKGTKLRIRLIAVENDSRCPSDVTCVWAGNAAVQLQLSTGRQQDCDAKYQQEPIVCR